MTSRSPGHGSLPRRIETLDHQPMASAAAAVTSSSSRRRTLLRRIERLDRRLVARVATADSPFLDYSLPQLSRAADHSVLWLAVAAGLGVTKNKWARRAALRGLTSIAIASATANVVAKGLTGRKRPESEIPLLRQLVHVPTTTSFPSGHSASAAAFATGVALEIPALALPMGALALAVGASRVVTGVHYPSDVLAGFAIGTAAGTLTLRWWPRRPMQPAQATRPRQDAPAAPTGEGLVLAVNASAGSTSSDLAAGLREELPDAEVIEVSDGENVAGILREAARRARIIGVAGGDGSVNVAADAALATGLPLLVIPAGTFNHFATDLGVNSTEDALSALRIGDAVCVDVGVAGTKAFLNTSSLGVYADLVRARERLERRIGKWPALVVALVHVLRSSRPQDVFVNGRRRRLWLLFAGNCCYAPQGFAPSYRPDLSDGLLDVRLVDAKLPLARLRLLAAVLTGTLGRSRVYRAWTAPAVEITAADGTPIRMSIDGELVGAGAWIRLAKRPGRLLVYRKVPEDQPAR
ncbi:MAG: bifunctional phosphatase PAP2/diacylglycerol kinase family protein [Micromonosporaceae bacterium]